MRWSHFKLFVDTYGLSIHWRLSGDTGKEVYKLVASDALSGVSHTCVLDYADPTPTGSNQEDFEDNYMPNGNVSSTDGDNTPYSRLKAASKGWTFQDRCQEFKTATLGSLVNTDIAQADYADAELKFYDENLVEITSGDQADLDADCAFTELLWTLPEDLEIIGGDMTVLVMPTVDVRAWCQGAPTYSGPVMISGVNFKFKKTFHIDGKVVKKMLYNNPLPGTNTLRKLVSHPKGHKSEFLLEWGHYRE